MIRVIPWYVGFWGFGMRLVCGRYACLLSGVHLVCRFHVLPICGMICGFGILFVCWIACSVDIKIPYKIDILILDWRHFT